MTSEARDAKTVWREWEQGQANILVDCINSLRDQQGLTVKALSERLIDFGWPVGLGTLNGILSGRKRSSFSYGELVAFAQALSVPLAYLLIGMPVSALQRQHPDADQGIPPVVSLNRFLGDRSQIRGEEFFGPKENVAIDEKTWADAHETLDALRDYARALRTVIWQNSLQIGFSEMAGSDVLERVFPNWMLSGGALREELHRLAEIRNEYVLRTGSADHLPLPPALHPVDERGFTAHSLELPIVDLSSVEDLSSARNFIKRMIDDARLQSSESGR